MCGTRTPEYSRSGRLSIASATSSTGSRNTLARHACGAMFTLCARVIAGLVALMLLPAFAVRAFCNLLIRYQDESPNIGAFADALTMHVDDDVDEAIRQSRTAARVSLSAVHSAVFEPLTYHSTPLPYTNPACRAALTCTTNATW